MVRGPEQQAEQTLLSRDKTCVDQTAPVHDGISVQGSQKAYSVAPDEEHPSFRYSNGKLAENIIDIDKVRGSNRDLVLIFWRYFLARGNVVTLWTG